MEASGLMMNYETVDGEPITVGTRTLRPQSRVLDVRWPGGGFVVNHPHRIFVEDAAQRQEIAIPNLTRRARWAMLGLAALFLIIGLTRR
ncbi:MAG: hypothetical protein R2873_03435 [Caldilineaceae bacterium]|nr:hypothetical protein [Caldilineaceae bacterium]